MINKPAIGDTSIYRTPHVVGCDSQTILLVGGFNRLEKIMFETTNQIYY